MQRTPLYNAHCQAGAHFVDFSGWEMPIHYGSQLEEHRQVRTHAGLFDVSHMVILDIEGEEAVSFLRRLLANDIQKLKVNGEALYSCLLNDAAGIIDDLIVYRMADSVYRLVVNASRRDADLSWCNEQAQAYSVRIRERDDLAMLALQGPHALSVATSVFDSEWIDSIKLLKPFTFMDAAGLQIARTGYTGEAGFEIILANDLASTWWSRFIAAGAIPCGLGARDTLRLEAGLNLYGVDMDESTSPWVCNLGWTLDFKDEARDFIGKSALLAEKKSGVTEQLLGLIMEQPGMLRNHQKVMVNDELVGEITSGSFSPTLGHAIALARIQVNQLEHLTVERRGSCVPVRAVNPPFVRHGKKVYTLKGV